MQTLGAHQSQSGLSSALVRLVPTTERDPNFLRLAELSGEPAILARSNRRGESLFFLVAHCGSIKLSVFARL